jgi:hypothetical protein
MKMLECPIFQILCFTFLTMSSDISDQIRYFHRVPVSRQSDPIEHIRPQVRYIRPAEYVRSPSGSRTVASCASRTYPTHRICPPSIGFQRCCTPPCSDISNPYQIYLTQLNSIKFESPIGHIRSRSDISDVLTPPTVISL